MLTAKLKHHDVAHLTRKECDEQKHHFVNEHELRQRIEKRAYELYQKRGCVPGFEWEDWFEAERQEAEQAR